MNCPCCNNEMEQGVLQGMERVAWLKKPRKVSLLPEGGEIMLENNLMKRSVLTAHICKACKKIVVDYSDKDYQMMAMSHILCKPFTRA